MRPSNSTGMDDANHDPEGIFISARMSDLRSGTRKGTRIERASCLDITPTILREFGLPVPTDLLGKPISIGTSGDKSQVGVGASIRPRAREIGQPSEKCGAVGFTPEEEEMVKKRLMELGYV